MTGAPRPDGAARDEKHAGFVLLVVVWFLILLSAMGTWILAAGRSETALAHNVVAAAQAQALADGGVAEAAFHLTDAKPDDHWALDGLPHQVASADGDLTIAMTDENEKINPNLAASPLIAALFVAVGGDRSVAGHLGDAIAAAVHPPDQPRAAAGNGPGQPAAAAHAEDKSLQSLDELSSFPGMTPALLAAARPFLTVYGTVARPDTKGAAVPVKRALDLAPDNAAGDAPDTAEARSEGLSDASAPTGQDAAAAASDTEVIASVSVTARTRDGAVFVRDAVIRLASDAPKGYLVLDWARGRL